VSGNGFIIKTPDYDRILSSEMSDFRQKETFTDVTIRCKNGSLSAHKFILSKSSKILRENFFYCQLFPAEVLCPDFSVESTCKVIELLYTGSSFHDGSSSHLLQEEMKEIVQHLGLAISMPDLETEENQSPRPTLQQQNGEIPISDEVIEAEQVVFANEVIITEEVVAAKEVVVVKEAVIPKEVVAAIETVAVKELVTVREVVAAEEVVLAEEVFAAKEVVVTWDKNESRQNVESHEDIEDQLKIEELSLTGGNETFPLESCNKVFNMSDVQELSERQQLHEERPQEELLHGVQIQQEKQIPEKASSLLSCSVCDKTFSIQIALKKHQLRFHKTLDNPEPALSDQSMPGDVKGQVHVQEGMKPHFQF
jgi:hypothetical protein